MLLRLFVFSGVVIAAGCQGDYRPLATGDNAEILVIVDSVQWAGIVGDAIRDELGRDIGTLPAPEPIFELHATDIEDDFDILRERKNILIATVLNDGSQEAEYVRARLPETGEQMLAEGGEIFAVRPDLWMRSQMVVYVAAATPQDLVRLLRLRGDELRSIYNEIIRERLALEMFETARQVSIEDSLMRRHGFAVHVQHDYRIAIESNGFVWLRRLMPDTWRSFFIHYESISQRQDLSPERVRAMRDSLTKQHIRGNLHGYVTIDTRRPLESRRLTFLGRSAIELRGLWHMVEEREDGSTHLLGMGGPFLTYAFYDPPSGRMYLLDGMVFAPNFDKREFLRQVEAVAYTFRTGADSEERARGLQQPVAFQQSAARDVGE